MKKMLLIIAGVALLSTFAFGADHLPLRITKYLADQGFDIPDGQFSEYVTVVVPNTLTEWKVPGIPEPTAGTLPSYNDSKVLLLPEKYRKRIGYIWTEKTQAEKDAADDAIAEAQGDPANWTPELKAVAFGLYDALTYVGDSTNFPLRDITTNQLKNAVIQRFKEFQ